MPVWYKAIAVWGNIKVSAVVATPTAVSRLACW